MVNPKNMSLITNPTLPILKQRPLLTVTGNWSAVQKEWQARNLVRGGPLSDFEYSILDLRSGGRNEYVEVDREFYASVNRTVLPNDQSFPFAGENWLRLFWLISGNGDQEIVPTGHQQVPSVITREALLTVPGYITYELQPDNFIKVESLRGQVPLQWVSVALSRRAVQHLFKEDDCHIPSQLDRYLRLDDSLLMMHKAPISPNSMAILKAIFDNPLSGSARYQYLCGLLRSLVYLALGHDWQTSDPLSIPGGLQRRMMEAAAYLKQIARTSSFNIEDVARHFGISRSQFHHQFLATFNQSPARYAYKERMAYAAELLVSGEKSMKEISLELGYRTQTAFYKAFVKQYNVSPTDYRRNIVRAR